MREIKQLSCADTFCTEYRIGIAKIDQAYAEAFKLSLASHVDIILQRDDVYRRHRRLVVFDMDSTLIEQEVIDEIARYERDGSSFVRIWRFEYLPSCERF